MITTLLRILVGGLFVFSGFIKANDPLGFAYKLEEYFGVFGTDIFVPYATLIAMLITLVEMVVGFSLLIGARKKLVLWTLLLMILFFTFLTFWSAYFNVVTDCGCFGDFLHMTPWQSFTKDVVLLVMTIGLFIGQKQIKPLFSTKTDWKLIGAFKFGIIVFMVYSWYYLPLWDLRAYKVGTDIPAAMAIPEGAPLDEYEDTWMYRVNGEVKTFTTDQAPWDIEGAEFVDRKTRLIKKGYTPPIHDFTITTIEGDEFTDDYLQADVAVIFVAYDLSKSRESAWEEVRGLLKWADMKAYRSAVLTASTADQLAAFEAKYNYGLPFYITDGTTLKTIVRSNPGLMLLKKGKVMGLWPSTALPGQNELEELLD
jgi:uncharacterized membrane protein YphA (DoxX/SURF4 family)